ncbi:MAG: response regulator [Synergistaceae bacterium]|nr:response regulator [Synergistaceae bacterium]
MLVLNNLDTSFIEITVLPFLLVMAAFLSGRMATTSEINRRFLLLVISTIISASFELVLELFTDIKHITIYTKFFYATININAYCLMCYVAAYTRVISERFTDINFFLLCISIILLFMFKSEEKIFMIFSPGFAIIFVTIGFVLQLIYQEYYGNGQFIVMNVLFILLIDSFVVQYLFRQNIPVVYTVATIMLVFTFFYLEAPTYRQLITAQYETEVARGLTEASINRANIANKAKSNFLASTSHEIRTPMNAILGINDMILNENPDAETRKAALDIKKAGEYLLALVNNILDISKIEAGKMDLYESDYHLWELLKECESYTIEAIHDRPGIKFILNADKTLIEHLHGDVLRLKQVLTNLLNNSAKYTKSGSITLSVEGQKASGSEIILKFTVEDTGIGMRKEETKKMFEPFERANIVETRHILGAGLGLTLVKNIIDIMSGRIKLESEYGKGTKITFEVPQRPAHGENMTIQEYEEFLKNEELKKPAETEIDEGPSVWPDAKILIVDDTPVNLVVAKGMLKDSQAKIDTAESGEDALDKIKAEHYDIVFLDHKMPGMDGVETLHHAKNHAEGTHFIALTANAGANARNEYIALGFDDYLPKPFKSMEMMKILKECLNKKK